MSDRMNISPERSPSSTHTTSSNSDITAEHPNKKSTLSFNLLDSILSRSITKPVTIHTKNNKSPTRSSSSSCPQALFQLPEQARCLYNYNARKEDEICVHRGEYVQILTASQDNRWFVRRNANRTSSTVQGWLPGFVIALKCPNSTTTNNNLSASPLPTSSISSNSINHL
jgi:hypothetical protein